MEKKCLECEKELFGRIDKKFCDDQCRSSYNNRQNSDVSNYVRNINNTLRRNRRILENLIGSEEKATVKRDKLVDLGFNFNYFTSIYSTKEKGTYYFCYDYGYLKFKDDWYALVKRKEWS